MRLGMEVDGEEVCSEETGRDAQARPVRSGTRGGRGAWWWSGRAVVVEARGDRQDQGCGSG
jgi:hypothetical protein